MNKLFYFIIAILTLSNVAMAQNSKSFYNTPYESRNSGSFEQSAALLSFGLGFPNVAGDHHGNNGFPPLYAKFEHGVFRDEVGLGGYVSSGWGTTYKNGNSNETNFNAFSVGILGYYHFNKLIPIKEMDVYVATGFAYRVVSYNDYYENNNDVLLVWHAGIRYYVKPKFSFYFESGYDGMSQINLGVTLKLQ
jgi:hypothetical protein